jgi:hypothetical protein
MNDSEMKETEESTELYKIVWTEANIQRIRQNILSRKQENIPLIKENILDRNRSKNCKKLTKYRVILNYCGGYRGL